MFAMVYVNPILALCASLLLPGAAVAQEHVDPSAALERYESGQVHRELLARKQVCVLRRICGYVGMWFY
jgi:hypothetical protein